MKKIFRIVIVFHLLTVAAQAQNAAPKSGDFLYFPREYTPWQFQYFAGLSMAQLPTKIVEDVFGQVPTIDLEMRFGLPSQMGVTTSINTNILTNQASVGFMYSLSSGRVSLNVVAECLVWYGFMRSMDFDVSVLGWGYSPYLSVGYDFSDFLLTMRAEVNIESRTTYMRGVRYEYNTPLFVGGSLSVAVEQPLWKNNVLALGFRMYYTRSFYKSWISFSAFDEYIRYPEFFAGFVF